MKFFLIILLGLCTAGMVFTSAFPTPSTCSGTYNTFPNISTKPILAQSIENGQLYVIPYQGIDFMILNVTGSAYQMGFAQGILIKNQINQFVPEFFNWLDGYIQNNITFIEKLPSWLKKWVGKGGVEVFKLLLEINYIAVKSYIPQRFIDEMQGIADGAGINVWTIRQLNMAPELLKASCSMMGAWNQATSDGKLFQLRSLDWEEHAPIHNYPLVVIYHPIEQNSIPFANIAFPAFIGSLSGMSSGSIGVTERLWGLPSSQESRFGKPWNFALRDVMQFTNTIEEAVEALNQTHRTCAIYLGIGSSQSNTYRIIKYAAKYFQVFNDTSQDWGFNSDMPQIDGIIYKAYHEPACFRDIIQANYGNINVHVIRQIAAMDQTGDTQTIIMDHESKTIYVAYANPSDSTPAYNCPIVELDLKPFFYGNQKIT